MDTTHRILVIDDDARVLKYVARALSANHLEVETAPSGRTGIQRLAERVFDAVVCDLRMPDVDGLAVLDYSRDLPDAPVFILLTAYATTPNTVDAVRRGAADVVEKPIVDLDEFAELVKAHVGNRLDHKLVGGPWRDQVRRFAPSRVPLLITGEVGTGKHYVARALWRNAKQSELSFTVVNCAAVSGADPLIAAWDHAVRDGGGLVLDEVGALPEVAQFELWARLRPAGSDGSAPRVLALSSYDLRGPVQGGRFDRRLFDVLRAHAITLPPLRARRADIPDLVELFCRRFANRHNLPVARFTSTAIATLQEQSWPGNASQLKDLVERLCRLPAGHDVTQDDLLEELNASSALGELRPPGFPSLSDALEYSASLGEAVRFYEYQLILQGLQKTGGNQTEAARLLNTKRSTLADKIRRLGLRLPGDDTEEPD